MSKFAWDWIFSRTVTKEAETSKSLANFPHTSQHFFHLDRQKKGHCIASSGSMKKPQEPMPSHSPEQSENYEYHMIFLNHASVLEQQKPACLLEPASVLLSNSLAENLLRQSLWYFAWLIISVLSKHLSAARNIMWSVKFSNCQNFDRISSME